MRPSFARDSITVARAGVTTDRYGNTAEDWSNPATHVVDGCILQPMSGEETLSLQGNRVISRWTLDAPADADITAADRILYRGEVYTVDGDVGVWDSPTRQLDHLEAILQRVEAS